MAKATAHYYGVPFIHEVVRTQLAALEIPGGFDELRLDLGRVSAFQRRVFEAQIEAERVAGPSFVADRAFDNVAYLAAYGDGLADLVRTEAYQRYVADIRERGTVFFVRPEPEFLRDDGTVAKKDLEWESVLRTDEAVKLLLEYEGVRYVPVRAKSPQERARIVRGVLGWNLG